MKKIIINEQQYNKLRENVADEMFAFHGSPHDFNQFDISKMSTGEGCQAHGYGIYVAMSEKVGVGYARGLSHNKKKLFWKDQQVPEEIMATGKNHPCYSASEILHWDGTIVKAIRHIQRFQANAEAENNNEMVEYWNEVLGYLRCSKKSDFKWKPCPILYIVEIPDNDGDNYLEEFTPLTQNQRLKIADILEDLLWKKFNRQLGMDDERKKMNVEDKMYMMLNDKNSQNILAHIRDLCGSEKMAAELLRDAGIYGIHYDGRTDGECYTIFDADDLNIIQKKYL